MKQFIYYINYILMVEKSREQVSKKKKQTNKQTKNQFFDEKHNTTLSPENISFSESKSV